MPISWADIDAFSRFGGLRLTPWEIEIIETLDDLFIANTTKKSDLIEEPSSG